MVVTNAQKGFGHKKRKRHKTSPTVPLRPLRLPWLIAAHGMPRQLRPMPRGACRISGKCFMTRHGLAGIRAGEEDDGTAVAVLTWAVPRRTRGHELRCATPHGAD